jgi:hypothetical protein
MACWITVVFGGLARPWGDGKHPLGRAMAHLYFPKKEEKE